MCYCRRFFYLFLILIAAQSCLTQALNRMGVLDNQPVPVNLPVNGKTVVFVPVSHLAKKQFYDSLRSMVNEYEKAGFVCFLEGVRTPKAASGGDSMQLKRYRRLLGVNPSKQFYQQHEEVFTILKDKYGLMEQPSYEQLGVTQKFYSDFRYDSLLMEYEKQEGPVVLSHCDSITPLKSNYGCYSLSEQKIKHFHNKYLVDVRNEFLAKTVLASPYNRILIIYGRAHQAGVTKLLAASFN